MHCAQGPLTEHGFKDASTDTRQIHEWWTRWPHALIGMPTGERTGLAVLDVDMKNGKNGLRTLAGLRGTDELPVTPTVYTRPAAFTCIFSGLKAALGTRSGQAGAGSATASIGDATAATSCCRRRAPGIAGASTPTRPARRSPCPSCCCRAGAIPDARAPHRWRHGLAGVISLNSLSGIVRKLATARGAESANQPGERNALLFWGACRFGEAIAQGLIGEDDARRILTEAAARTGLQNYEIAKTIESAFGRAGQ